MDINFSGSGYEQEFKDALGAAWVRADADGIDRTLAGHHSVLRADGYADGVHAWDENGKIRDGAVNTRADAADGWAPAGLLTRRLARVLETPYAALDGDVLPTIQDTPIGAERVEYGRYDMTGEMAHHKVGQPIPMASSRLVTETRDVAHFVIGVETTMFQQQAASFAGNGLDKWARDQMAARAILLRGRNKITFSGYDGTGLFGLLTHPGIARSFDFSNWYLDATTGETVLSEFQAWAALNSDLSTDIGTIDTVMLSHRLLNLLSRKRYSAQVSESCLAIIKRDMGQEITFRKSTSLAGAGPAGQDGMFGYNSADPDSAFVDVIQPPTPLAPEREGFATRIYWYQSLGGFKSLNRFSALLGFAPAPA